MKMLFVAVNAQYVHTNLAVRSIKAYMQKHGQAAHIAEYTINQHPEDVVQALYRQQAQVYVFSCYIWNLHFIEEVAQTLRQLCPKVVLVAGGPQVSYNSRQFLRSHPQFDALLAGEGEQAALLMAQALGQGKGFAVCPGAVWRNGQEIEQNPPPAPIDMDEIPFTYEALEELDGRILYYESMRGCPYNCSYCLSSAEKGVRFKSIALVQQELARFINQKVKQVKFIDRTFNCNKKHAMAVWQYLAQHDNGHTNFHFELAGELLDQEMLAFLATVRPGLFQFEIGVQSTNEGTLQEIQRTANLPLLFANVQQLQRGKNIHLHLDLIAGLPLEDAASFARSFNQVYALRPQQLQLGMLKVLPGSGIQQKVQQYGMEFTQKAPFEVLFTRWLPYSELCILKQTAHMVELYYNSGRFANIIEFMVDFFETPFAFYSQLADFYREQGHFEKPLGKMGHYNLLGQFMQSKNIAITPKAQYWCKLDLCLHEKVKTLPSWVKEDMTQPLWQQVLQFYKTEEYIQRYLPEYSGFEAKQIRRMAHIEVLPFSPLMGRQQFCALLFNYARRDILGRAEVTDVTQEMQKIVREGEKG